MPENFVYSVPWKIGSAVKIDLIQIQDRIPIDLREQLTKDPVGVVVDYKMTDGQSIGIVVELKNASKCWFFPEEIHSTSKEISSKHTNDLMKTRPIFESRNNRKITTPVRLLNPINFIKWFLFTSKDIF